MVLEKFAASRPTRYRWSVILLFLLSLPTNLIVLMTAGFAAQTHEPAIYLAQGEVQAFDWIDEHTSPGALILAGSETGLYIPAYSRGRVIYGHPFETVDAEMQEAAVTEFFRGGLSPQQMEAFVSERDVDYVFVGPRERSLGDIDPLDGWQVVYETGDVVLYEVQE
jgi:hypothetical protein